MENGVRGTALVIKSLFCGSFLIVWVFVFPLFCGYARGDIILTVNGEDASAEAVNIGFGQAALIGIYSDETENDCYDLTLSIDQGAFSTAGGDSNSIEIAGCDPGTAGSFAAAMAEGAAIAQIQLLSNTAVTVDGTEVPAGTVLYELVMFRIEGDNNIAVLGINHGADEFAAQTSEPVLEMMPAMTAMTAMSFEPMSVESMTFDPNWFYDPNFWANYDPNDWIDDPNDPNNPADPNDPNELIIIIGEVEPEYYSDNFIDDDLNPDRNGDNIVNLIDFAVLAGNWGATGSGLECDFDGDGGVDSNDLGYMADYWLWGINTVIYVDCSASGNNDGTSWANAYVTINDAADNAIDGDEIWVAGGTYQLYTSGEGTVEINNAVSIYGGFAGTETHRSQRDRGQNNTIIDGQDEYQCFRVYKAATIDGFVIRNGRADSASYNCGGGINSYGVDLIIENCVFYNNVAWGYNSEGGGGGGVYLSEGISSPFIVNCVFAGNYAEDNGGALYIGTYSQPSIINCTFYANYSDTYGGAVKNANNYGGSDYISLFVNTIFWGNSNNASWPSRGEEIYNHSEGRMDFINCDIRGGITGSYVDGEDGGYYIFGTGNINVSPGFVMGDSYIYSTITEALLKGSSAGNWMTSNDGLMIQSGSPCRNNGNNTYVSGVDTDITGSDRTQELTVDIGAYEY